jgi:hypothetical protein
VLTLQNLRFSLWTILLHLVYFNFLVLLVGCSAHWIELVIVLLVIVLLVILLRYRLTSYTRLLRGLMIFIVVGLLARWGLPLKSLTLCGSLRLLVRQRLVRMLQRC